MAFLETVISFVNTWECDENAHLNVQFYFARFDAAARVFAAECSIDPVILARPDVRHVRYHSEMRSAERVVVRTAAAADAGPQGTAIVHELIEPESGRICATALDGHSRAFEFTADRYVAEVPRQARPRSFDPTPASEIRSAAELSAVGGTVTYRGAVYPADCDTDGRALDRAIISAFSDGASQIWAMAGLTADYLDARGLGRVAVETKLSRSGALPAGSTVTMVSTLTALGSKAFSFRHHVFDTETGGLAAIGDVTAVVMDLEKRKAIEIPADIRAIAEGKLVKAPLPSS